MFQETRFYYFPWLYTSICEILFMVAFGIFIFYRYYHNVSSMFFSSKCQLISLKSQGWSLFAAIIYWSTAAYHFYLYCVVLSLYYYIKRLQEPNFVIVYPWCTSGSITWYIFQCCSWLSSKPFLHDQCIDTSICPYTKVQCIAIDHFSVKYLTFLPHFTI